MTRGSRRLWGLALVAFAIGVRALAWRQVLLPDGVLFVGWDAYYHLRRIVYGVVRFPELPGFDPYLNHPLGAKPIWSPVFDWAVAALAAGFGTELGGDGLAAFERAVVWLPPLLGAAAVGTAMGLARRRFGVAEGWLAGGVLALLPAHVWYTQLGFVDHHAAVAWLSTAVVAGLWALHAAVGRGAPTREIAGLAAACGGLVAVSLGVWPGFALHLGFIELGVGATLIAAPTGAQARRWAGALAGVHGVAALAVSPLAWGELWPQWGPASPLVLSRFQPGLLAGLAAGAAACALGWRRAPLAATPGRRAAALLGLGVLGAAAWALAQPAWLDGLAEALRWLARRDGFQGAVAESAPLLRGEAGQFSLGVAGGRFGPFLAVYPLALVALAAAARRRPGSWIFVCWAAGLFAATLVQRRFFATASVGYAIVAALALCGAWRGAAARGGVAARAAVVAAAAICLLPLVSAHGRPLANEWRAWRGEPLRVPPGHGVARAGAALASWLERHTPPTRGWLSTAQRPEYGVLAPWHLGHVIVYRGRRPTAVGNFGDDLGAEGFAWARDAWAAREAELVESLEARRIRYVVAERRPRARPGSFAHALFALDGSDSGSTPALVRHRLVYESPGIGPGDPEALYKLYERVAGAEVVGRAAPGTRVEAALALRTPRGRRLVYRTGAVADAAGGYRLRLPYANRGGPGSVEVASHYELRCGEGSAPLVLDEAAVREGRRVPAPAACQRP